MVSSSGAGAKRLAVLERHLAATLPSSPDQDGLLEYSVVYTDRSINHMSKKFIGIMQELTGLLRGVYNAPSMALVPGGGSYGMEAVARQFCSGKKGLVIRNGYFSYRWTDIFEQCNIPSEHIVLKGRPNGPDSTAQFAPCPIEEVAAAIHRERPAVVFAPHVETSAGMMLPDDYITAVGAAAHSVGALFVLDCVASGCIWVDMKACNVDVIISAPQKGWSGPPCAGVIMLSERARIAIDETESTSMVLNLKAWVKMVETYDAGGHAYHTTMPTDGLATFLDVAKETQAIGFDKVKQLQLELGVSIRKMLESRGIKSVAAPGFQAVSVVVSHTSDPAIQSGKRFMDLGMQIASGVPLKCDEHSDYKSFRIGLFGLDKLMNIPRTLSLFEDVLNQFPA